MLLRDASPKSSSGRRVSDSGPGTPRADASPRPPAGNASAGAGGPPLSPFGAAGRLSTRVPQSPPKAAPQASAPDRRGTEAGALPPLVPPSRTPASLRARRGILTAALYPEEDSTVSPSTGSPPSGSPATPKPMPEIHRQHQIGTPVEIPAVPATPLAPAFNPFIDRTPPQPLTPPTPISAGARNDGPEGATNRFPSAPTTPNTHPTAITAPRPATPTAGAVGQEAQTCRVIQNHDSTERTGLRTVYIIIKRNDEQESLLLLLGEGRQVLKRTRLFGYRVVPSCLSRTNEDVVPSFVDNCICLRKNTVTNDGFALAFPNAETLAIWSDRLCAAGCIMRDINEHLEITRTFRDFQIGRPTSMRTMTTKEVVALKFTSDGEKQKQLFNEARYLMRLRHEHIPLGYGLYEVKYQGVYGMGLILDYFEGHDLSSWMGEVGLPEWVMKPVVVQLLDALRYLGNVHVVHRDLKPPNVFLEPGKDGSLKVVLADFGLATRVEDEDIMRRCGSPGFVAPELFQKDWTNVHAALSENRAILPQVLKIDMFSLGVTIYAMAFGRNPFIGGSLDETYKRNARGRMPTDELTRASAELQSAIEWMAARDPIMRCSSSEVAAHPWLNADLNALGFTGDPADVRGDSISWRLFEQTVGELAGEEALTD